MLDCYVNSVMSCGCETWAYSKIVQNKIDAFQLWCYRRMLKIRYTDHVTNTRVKEIIGIERENSGMQIWQGENSGTQVTS